MRIGNVVEPFDRTVLGAERIMRAAARRAELMLPLMTGTADDAPVRKTRLRRPDQWAEDVMLWRMGVLDRRSLLAGHTPMTNPVEVVVTDAFGQVKAIRYTHNLRTKKGTDLTALLWASGQSTANNAPGFRQTSPGTSVALTAPAAGTVGIVNDTNSNITSATAAANQFQGYTMVYGSAAGGQVCAHLVGNNASGASAVKWYFDQWFAPNDPSTSVSAPSANQTYLIVPSGPAYYLGLSTDSAAPAATDLFMQTSGAALSEIGSGTLPGVTDLGRAYFAGSGYTYALASGSTNNYKLQHLFTATGSYTGVQKCGMFTGCYNPNDTTTDATNLTNKGGGIMLFENTFAAVNLLSTDTLTVTWTVNF